MADPALEETTRIRPAADASEDGESTHKLDSANVELTAAEKRQRYVLQRVQPALLGLMDGSVSTLGPLFAVAEGDQNNTHLAFVVGLAASVGAGISMGLAEALSDDGKVSGRGHPIGRGAITGLATTLGGMLHTFPFLIHNFSAAFRLATIVVVFELLAIAWIRYKFMESPLWKTVLQVIVGGAVVFGIGYMLGKFAGPAAG